MKITITPWEIQNVLNLDVKPLSPVKTGALKKSFRCLATEYKKGHTVAHIEAMHYFRYVNGGVKPKNRISRTGKSFFHRGQEANNFFSDGLKAGRLKKLVERKSKIAARNKITDMIKGINNGMR